MLTSIASIGMQNCQGGEQDRNFYFDCSADRSKRVLHMVEREVEVNKGMTMKMNDTGNVTELDMRYQVTQRK